MREGERRIFFFEMCCHAEEWCRGTEVTQSHLSDFCRFLLQSSLFRVFLNQDQDIEIEKKSGEMLLTKQDALQLRKSPWFFVQSGHCEVSQWPAPTTTVTTIACRSHQQHLLHNLDWISQQQKLSSSVLLEVLPERDASKCYIKLPFEVSSSDFEVIIVIFGQTFC